MAATELRISFCALPMVACTSASISCSVCSPADAVGFIKQVGHHHGQQELPVEDRVVDAVIPGVGVGQPLRGAPEQYHGAQPIGRADRYRLLQAQLDEQDGGQQEEPQGLEAVVFVRDKAAQTHQNDENGPRKDGVLRVPHMGEQQRYPEQRQADEQGGDKDDGAVKAVVAQV